MTTTIELLRHAEAVGRDRWWGRPDRERPLTDDGRRHARAICRALGDEGPIDGLYSSPLLRCVDTLESLRLSTGLHVVGDERLAEVPGVPVLDGGDAWVSSAWLGGRGLAFLDHVLAKHSAGRLVACSHGDVIPAVMAALVGRDALGLTDVRCPKGGRFTLTFDGLRCVRARLGPAP